MALPYQCLVARNESAEASVKWTLFGASGPKLVAQTSDRVSSVWTKQDDRVSDAPQEDESEGPPGKRVKLSPSKEQKPNFSTLVLSRSGQYLVAVTGEDKCIRVFETDSQNRLHQLSERCMTRRPCSITLTSDDATILCADKFGDVYSLPLLPSPDYEPPEAPVAEPEQEVFAPSATVLTVHSGRNRKTLEEQLRQQASKGPAPPKDVMKFEHKLLLGHVSMLTDIVNAQAGSRSYIITADRDEHIRVSRSVPQAHVIEGFCFGHEAFISKLCLTQSGLLVSGGGDAHLLVWDWQNYKLVEKLPIRDVVLSHLKSRPELGSAAIDEDAFKIAVSGIWDVSRGNGQTGEVLVACEGVPAVFSFKISASATSGTALALHGNALNVAVLHTSQTLSTVVVTIDHVHKPGSTKEVREERSTALLQTFSAQPDGVWQEDTSVLTTLEWFNGQGAEIQVDCKSDVGGDDSSAGNGTSAADKALRDVLYNVENLRKRPGAED